MGQVGFNATRSGGPAPHQFGVEHFTVAVSPELRERDLKAQKRQVMVNLSSDEAPASKIIQPPGLPSAAPIRNDDIPALPAFLRMPLPAIGAKS